jgi:hypothetical protein
MKNFTGIFTLCFVFAAGVGVGLGAYHLHEIDQAMVEGKERWFICKIVHQSALLDRAELFWKKTGRWSGSVGELVEAHLLPAWSEIHWCPSEMGVEKLVRTEYNGTSFIEENRTGLVAHYTSSPYRFRVEGDKLIVECVFDKSHNDK